jgi:hypothetical protein
MHHAILDTKHLKESQMKNSIITILFLSVCLAPSVARSEVVHYQCNNNDTGFQINTASSQATLEKRGYFGNFTITSPVSFTGSSAYWQMKNKLDLSCSYTANVSFYKITDPRTISTQCPSGNGAQIIFTGKCPDGGGSQTWYCCAR